jgi:hypothetical protein
MAELLPCPFCGEEEIYAEISYLAKEFRIYCASGGCTAGMRLSFEDAGLGEGGTIDFAEMQTIMLQMIDLWNTRTPKERGGEK